MDGCRERFYDARMNKKNIFWGALMCTSALLAGALWVAAQEDPQTGNDVLALDTIRTLAENGHTSAMYNLGVIYYQGNDVDTNYAEAVKWFEMAAEKNDMDAIMALALIYSEGGFGVTQDYAKVVEYYKKAAEMGNPIAQYNLGTYHEAGMHGMMQDFKEAMNWYIRAAENGDEDALKKLEEQTFKDLAFDFYKERAEQGVVYAQINLAKTLAEGTDERAADYQESHKWLNIATALGGNDLSALRNRVEEFMSFEEIQQAQEKARIWLDNYRLRGSNRGGLLSGRLFPATAPGASVRGTAGSTPRPFVAPENRNAPAATPSNPTTPTGRNPIFDSLFGASAAATTTQQENAGQQGGTPPQQPDSRQIFPLLPPPDVPQQ